MLMALLPLAGFAEDLSLGKMVIPSTYYGYAPTWSVDAADYDNLPATDIKVYDKVNTLLKKGVDYTVDGFFSDKDCTEPNKLSETQVKAKEAGTVIYAKVTGKSTYENSLVASFEIKKMPLILYGTPGTKVYNNDATKDGTLFTFKSTTSGSTTTVSADAVKEGYGASPANLVGANAKFGTNPASKISFTRAKGEGVGNKALTATITDATLAKNYTIASTDIKTTDDTPAQAFYSITAKEFSVDVTSGSTTTLGTLVITVNDSGDNLITYTGYAQHPTYTVYDKALKVNLKEGTDFTVAYKNGDTEDACIIAGEHHIKFTGKGNYAETPIQKTFNINPAILLVKPVAMKIYNGSATLPTVPESANANNLAWHPTNPATPVSSHFEFQGFVDNMTAANVTFNTAGANTEAPAWTWNNAADATANANAENTTYALKIANEDVNKAFTLANYTFKAQKGTYTISKADLIANVKEDALNYGEEKTFTLVPAGDTPNTDAGLNGAIPADFAALRNAIKVTQAETAEETGANAGKYKLYAEWRTDDEITAWVTANAGTAATAEQIATAIAAAKTSKGNYELSKTAGSNWLTFNAADLTIALDLSKYILTKVYDGEPISVELDKENGLIIDGKVNESDVINLDNLKLEVVGDNKGAYQATPYVLRLSGATAKNYNIHYVAAQYTIKQRPLNITVYDQSFVTGTAPSIIQTAYEITNTGANEGLASTDTYDKVFKLAFASGTVTLNEGKITNGQGTVNEAIEAVNCGVSGSKWDNYKVTVVKGNAIILGAAALVLDDTKDMKDDLAAAYAAGIADTPTKYAVSFTDRALTANSWNVMVLPFDATVSEISRALGYAVIDAFDQNASDGNIHFDIYMGTIKANTPFMFKVDGEKKNFNQIVFENKTIVWDTTNADDEAVKIENNCPYVADQAGNKLVGFYGKQAQNTVAANEYYLGKVEGKITWRPAEAAFTIKGERAKLVLAEGSQARQILVEEPDGTTTAISLINTDNVVKNYTKDGWYTVNGVKLNDMPSAQGVYIHNGKKVVIK